MARKPRTKSRRGSGAARRSKEQTATAPEGRSRVFDDDQLAKIVALRNGGAGWSAVGDELGVSAEAVRRAYNNYGHLVAASDTDLGVQAAIAARKQTRARGIAQRQLNQMLDWAAARDSLMDQVRDLLADTKFTQVKLPAPPKARTDRPGITAELMVSDVHIGKVTPHFNIEVCRARLRKLVTVFLQELERKRAHYNLDRIILAFLGDNIENALMHGRESAKGCEFGNAEQLRQCIDLFFHEVLIPVAALGVPIDLVGIAGNHDREDEHQTYHEPGKSALTWVVYKTMELLAQKAGLANVTCHIPEGAYAVLKIYRDHILYEHGHFMKGGDRKTFRNRLATRSAQLGVVLRGLRLGHWHEYSCYDNGMAIVNASVCGEDSYSDVNAFGSLPGQVITYYVSTTNRDNDYYYSFLVQL